MAEAAHHEYENLQSFNKITTFLHKTRYRNLVKVAGGLTPRHGARLQVVDIGCGVGKAYAELDRHCPIDYHGIELGREFVDLARGRYGDRANFSILCGSIADHLDALDTADLIIGLESFEHIPEDIVVRVVERIGRADFQRLYVTVPNEIGPAIAVKNIGSFMMGYQRYKEYAWRETLHATLYNLDKVGLHDTGHKGFDWRWLAQTLRHNCEIIETFTSPLQLVPRAVSPSIGFLCARRTAAAAAR